MGPFTLTRIAGELAQLLGVHERVLETNQGFGQGCLGVGWLAKLVGLSPVVARNIIKLILREIHVFVFIHGDVEQLAAPAMV